MGADRISSTFIDFLQQISNLPFSQADKLWGSYQTNLAEYINTHGGHATVGRAIKERPSYDMIQAYLNGSISLEQLKAQRGCQ
jgi:hypothetical protein